MKWLRIKDYIEKHQDVRSVEYRLTDTGEQLARIVCDIEVMVSQLDQAD